MNSIETFINIIIIKDHVYSSYVKNIVNINELNSQKFILNVIKSLKITADNKFRGINHLQIDLICQNKVLTLGELLFTRISCETIPPGNNTEPVGDII